MRVSAKAEYACIAMLELASSHGDPQPVRIKTIALAHDISQRFLMQILLQLKGAGLVASTRGASGGYQLTRQPDEISLADIVNAIDRLPIHRPPAAVAAGTLAFRAIRSVWHEAQQRERRFLEDITLAELVRRTQQSSALMYQI